VVDLQHAATGMGALVALVRPDFGQVDERTDLEQTARVLGRLYDAVLCFDLPPSVVQQLGAAAAVPVVDADGDESRRSIATGPAIEDQARLLLARLASLGV
jgi:ornithine carbamoyltransferase